MGPVKPSHRDQRGIVGVQLVLVMAFALYAVIMLSRTTLAATQIDDHVRVIVEEVGPGSNVSRLEEIQHLDSVGTTAEQILAAARPLSGQAQGILDTVRSVDSTASAIVGNAGEINSSVRSIGAAASELLPVARAINGQGASAAQSSGVAGINMRADAVRSEVTGISTDLATVARTVRGPGAESGTARAHTIENHVSSINCALTSPSGGLIGVTGGLLGTLRPPLPPGTVTCG